MNRPLCHQPLMSLAPGVVVRTNHLFFDHVGILSDRLVGGERTVLSFSARKGGFAEETVSDFSEGRQILIGGYPGALPSELVMQRARQKRNQKYNLFDFNCEHFVSFAHGRIVESPQLHFWTFVGLAASAVVLLSRVKKA